MWLQVVVHPVCWPLIIFSPLGFLLTCPLSQKLYFLIFGWVNTKHLRFLGASLEGNASRSGSDIAQLNREFHLISFLTFLLKSLTWICWFSRLEKNILFSQFSLDIVCQSLLNFERSQSSMLRVLRAHSTNRISTTKPILVGSEWNINVWIGLQTENFGKHIWTLFWFLWVTSSPLPYQKKSTH